MPSGDAKAEIEIEARQAERGFSSPRGVAGEPKWSVRGLAIGRHGYVGTLEGDLSRRAGGPFVVGAVDELAAHRKQTKIVEEGGINVGIRGKEVLMVALDAGEHDAPRPKGQKVAPVFAGFGDEIALAADDRRAAAETRDRRPGQDGRGQPQRGDDAAGQGRRSGLSVHAGDARGVGPPRKRTEGLWIIHDWKPSPRRLDELGIDIARVCRRMDNQTRLRGKMVGVEAHAEVHSERLQNRVRIEDLGNVAPGEYRAARRENFREGRHSGAFRAH